MAEEAQVAPETKEETEPMEEEQTAEAEEEEEEEQEEEENTEVSRSFESRAGRRLSAHVSSCCIAAALLPHSLAQNVNASRFSALW